MNLNHLHINVPSVREAQKFYESFFGFKLLFEHGEGIFMGNSEGFLLAIDPLKEGEGPHAFPEWFHFGFCVSEPQKVRDLYKKMKMAGIEFARDLKEFGEDAVNFYCWAPGKYKLEVSWNRSE